MRFATRINSFKALVPHMRERVERILAIPGITDLELNYPEHMESFPIGDINALLKRAGKKCSGCAVRFRSDYQDGEFSYRKNNRRAIDLAKETADVIRSMGGSCLSIWLAYDGFDYPFQLDYVEAMNAVQDAVSEIAEYAPDLQVSIEFKPRDPRSFSIVPNTGYTLRLVERIGKQNVGMTLDYCHSLMAAENPAMSIALAGAAGRLFGIHLNDGYGYGDDGLFFGSVSQFRALEFVYHLKRSGYDGLIYFDTFPVREDAVEETKMNLKMFNLFSSRIDEFGMDRIEKLQRSDTDFFGKKAILDLLLGIH